MLKLLMLSVLGVAGTVMAGTVEGDESAPSEDENERSTASNHDLDHLDSAALDQSNLQDLVPDDALQDDDPANYPEWGGDAHVSAIWHERE